MLRRKALDYLKKWKNNDGRKSLIIYGARQIGKTYIVRKFGDECYKSYIELNFVKNPELKSIFKGSLDVKQLLLNLSISVGAGKLIPGETLILLDEIQECEEALTSLKFWNEAAEYDVIATGSTLGMRYKNKGSYPVGNVEYYDMHSLDFEEFLWANGIDDAVISSLRENFEKMLPVSDFIHKRMEEMLKKYMILGGMPEVVDSFVRTNDISAADEIQKRIYRDYQEDIARYAPAQERIKARKCYDSIPFQLTKENHKFQYSQLESKATASKFESSIDWLKNAYLAVEVNNLKRIEFPAELYADETNFRLYPTDIGMLMAAYNIGIKQALLADYALEDVPKKLILGTAKGGLYEALAADMLIKSGKKDLYFFKDIKSTSEVEFIIQNEDGVIPIEIKAGKKRARSLDSILEAENIAYGYKFSSQNIGTVGKKRTLPMYMLMFI